MKTNDSSDFRAFIGALDSATNSGEILWTTTQSNAYKTKIDDAEMIISFVPNVNGNRVIFTLVPSDAKDNMKGKQISTFMYPADAETQLLLEKLFGTILDYDINNIFFKAAAKA